MNAAGRAEAQSKAMLHSCQLLGSNSRGQPATSIRDGAALFAEKDGATVRLKSRGQTMYFCK